MGPRLLNRILSNAQQCTIQAPFFNSGCTNSQDNNQNFQLLPAEKLTNVDDMTTKLAGIGSAWGTGPAALIR